MPKEICDMGIQNVRGEVIYLVGGFTDVTQTFVNND
jgi:hypothetical protein